MAVALTRVTTEYLPAEDRLRLTGDAGPDGPLVIWLTRRVLRMMLPALLRWLERQGGDLPRPAVIQSFALEAARADLIKTPSAPVAAAEARTAWLVQAVDLALADTAVQLTFRDEAAASAVLILEAKPLRQWLSIVYEQASKAEWELAVWPDWIRDSVDGAPAGPAVLH